MPRPQKPPAVRSYAKNKGRWLRRLGRALGVVVLPMLHRWLSKARRTTHEFHPETRALLDSGQGAIIACWHESMLLLLPLAKSVGGVTCLISPSDDGDIVAKAVVKAGFRVVQGSSRLGGHRAVSDLLAELGSGHNVLMIPDGPMGPARKVKPGLLRLSAASGKAVIPVTASVDRFKRLGSWDKMILPLRPKKLTIQYHAPLQVDAHQLPWYADQLAQSLNRLP